MDPDPVDLGASPAACVAISMLVMSMTTSARGQGELDPRNSLSYFIFEKKLTLPSSPPMLPKFKPFPCPCRPDGGLPPLAAG